MDKGKVLRAATVLISVLTIGLAGFGSFVSAESTISNTGPDSNNSIEFKNSTSCVVTNNNNLSLANSVNQNASSGNVTVDHNTSAGYPSNWGEWDPAVWAARGYSYDEWHSQFMAHMNSEAGNLRANWGNLSGGGASSGNASNNSNSNFVVHVSNGAGGSSPCGGSAPSGMPVNPPSGTIVHGASTEKKNGFTKVLGSGSAQNNAGSSAGNNTNLHTNPSGTGNNNRPNSSPSDPSHSNPGDDQSATISNTGPDSNNTITFANSSETNVTNNNVINVATTNFQTATSGDSTVNNNTSAGGGDSGNAANTSQTSLMLQIAN